MSHQDPTRVDQASESTRPDESRGKSVQSSSVLDQTVLLGCRQDESFRELIGTRYRIVAEIARGGMGVVLQAHDESFDRPLAIKILLARHDKADAAWRFLEEAAITGQLQHPGVPPVHDIGRLADGRPFFSMKLIEGRTLATLLRERPSTQSELTPYLKIFEQVAQTMAYAHGQGIIHRDLKPRNIMVGAFGEVQVMDWGLAKRLRPNRQQDGVPISVAEGTAAVGGNGGPSVASRDMDSAEPKSVGSHTQSGDVLGTLAYMSPEQARGEVDAQDEGCDVFGLGAILCTLLTGRPPYAALDRQDLWRQAREADLADAWSRLDACGADRELVRLARDCLAPRRDDRLGDASQVAGVIATYLASVQDRLQQARVARAEAETQVREERKRLRLTVGFAVAIVALVCVVGGASLWYFRDQGQRRAEAVARAAYLDREIAAAMDESQRLYDGLLGRLSDDRQAAMLLSDLTPWKESLNDARSTWQRADRLAAGNQALVSRPLLQRLTALDLQLQFAERDLELARKLDRIRMEALSVVEGGVEMERANQHMAGCFRDAGFDFDRSPPARIAEKVRQSSIRTPIVAALDFWAQTTPDHDARGRLLEAARRADPDPWRDRFRQWVDWSDPGKLRALVAEVDLTRESPQLLAGLAMRLRLTGEASEGVRLLRQALTFHPRDFWLNSELGLASRNTSEQIGAFRGAVALRTNSEYAWYSLGVVLLADRQFEPAAECFGRATELAPNYASAHMNLGLAVDALERPHEALEHFRRAIDLDPGHMLSHLNLGAAWQAQGKLDDAIACYQRVLELQPGYVPALNNLGAAWRDQGKLDEAIAMFRQVVENSPDHAMAWCNLGHSLGQQGQFRDALLAFERGHTASAGQADWTYPSAQWVEDTRRSLALDEKLTGMLQGEAITVEPRQQLEMAYLCQVHRKQFVTAARMYAAAFAAEPGLANNAASGHRYNAACAAAQAAAGIGLDAARLSASERLGLRSQAAEWLRADLVVWSLVLTVQGFDRSEVTRTLRHWQTDPNLEVVRDAAALIALPADEQAVWRQLWLDVDSLADTAEKASRSESTK